ncbi:MAG: DNA-binding response regulator [Pseudopedobacter saltans]|uniref:DNA-binding response regulator n=1 Tax=Pseudopedobacter saltans TaxID=151895 RepID=A0A2W5F5E2_9SPHI|nr:MAG: DNA-binding response regulator [Pseudopedobacter saltans]
MNGKKILIVEDEVNLAALVSKMLKEQGAVVDIAYDCFHGYDLLTTNNYDLMLLDRKLPGMSGLELCKKLRAENNAIAILMLTAMVTPDDIVNGLDTGADDYLTKPFNIKELQARIRSLLRRKSNSKAPSNLLQIADLVMDTSLKSVTRANKPITLTVTEYKLLEFLLQNQNKVISRKEILDSVWGIDFDLGTNVVDVYVNYLRKKIDKDYAYKVIQTVIGMGYMLRSDYEDTK